MALAGFIRNCAYFPIVDGEGYLDASCNVICFGRVKVYFINKSLYTPEHFMSWSGTVIFVLFSKYYPNAYIYRYQETKLDTFINQSRKLGAHVMSTVGSE